MRTIIVLFLVILISVSTRKYIEKRVPSLSSEWRIDELKSLNTYYYKIFKFVTVICLSAILVNIGFIFIG